MNRHSTAHPAFAGFTLVETMVAIVIGLLTTFIVMQVYAVSEGQKRTITGGADAQSDAAAILYLMERDLRQAGYGLSANPEDFNPAFTAPPGGVLTFGVLAQCTKVRAHNSNRPAKIDFLYDNSTFAPVVINPTGYPAGDSGTDIVLVNYGASSGVIGKGLPLGGEQDTGGDVLSLVVSGSGSPDPRAGFVQGDMVLAVPAPGSGFDCTIGEVTGLPGGANCSVGNVVQTTIERNAADSHSSYSNYYTACDAGPKTQATWNKVGADVDYTGGRLYNLGPVSAFVSRVYAVRKGNLTVCDLTKQDCTAVVDDPPDPAVWTPIASGVVGLHAQYGRDTDFNGSVDSWDTTTAPGGVVAAPAHVLAVRLGLTVRSGQYEKDLVTTVAPVWRADAPSTTDNIALIDTAHPPTADWQHYRYKTAQSIIPVRNLIWGQQNPL